jgi:hypothetical protein
MLIFNNNKPIKQKRWINTKVEFIWDGTQYVEQSAEGYWYEGEMALCLDLVDNDVSTHGTVRTTTAAGGYYGMLYGTTTSHANYMWDTSGNGGVYWEDLGWANYTEKSNGITTFMGGIKVTGSAADDKSLQVGDGFIKQSKTSYGSLSIDGTKGGYFGILYGTTTSHANHMWDTNGNGGIYWQDKGWANYTEKSTGITLFMGGIKVSGSAADDKSLQVGHGFIKQCKTSHGSLSIDGTKGGYFGILYGTGSYAPNYMWDAGGNGGVYWQDKGWAYYTEKSTGITLFMGGIKVSGSAADDKSLQVGHGFIKQSKTSYGSLSISGSKGGYFGILYGTGSYAPNHMWDTNGNGGVYWEDKDWAYYILKSSGNFGIGTTTPGYKLEVAGTFYSAGSSIDYKKHVTDLDVDSSLIHSLRPVSYNYKKEYKDFGYNVKEGKQIGLVSEEVAKTIPELAIMKDGKPKNVDYQKLAVVLLAEVQNLKKEVEELKCR